MPTAKNSIVFWRVFFVFHVSTILPVQTLPTHIEQSILNMTAVKFWAFWHQNRISNVPKHRSCQRKDYAAEINHSVSKLYSQLQAAISSFDFSLPIFSPNMLHSIYRPNKLLSHCLHWYHLCWKSQGDIRPYNVIQSHSTLPYKLHW